MQYNFGTKLNQEVGTVIKSVFTTLKEEGKTEGKVEAKTEIVKEMLLNKEPLEKIVKYSKFTEKKIKEIEKNLIFQTN